jgi:hypothetical protein
MARLRVLRGPLSRAPQDEGTIGTGKGGAKNLFLAPQCSHNVGIYVLGTVRNGGPLSTVCRSCSNRVQRLQDDWNNTPSSSGSRKRAPGTLRSQRGLPYNIHIRRTDLSVLECRRRGPVSVSFAGKNRCVSKGFFRKEGIEPGFEPTKPTFSTTVATGLKPGREHPSSFFSQSDMMS